MDPATLAMMATRLSTDEFTTLAFLLGFHGPALTYAQTADVMACSVATVKRRRRRAVAQLARVQALRMALQADVPRERVLGKRHLTS